MIVPLGLTLFIGGASAHSNKAEHTKPLFDVSSITLESGDVAFRRGGSLASELVLSADGRSAFSHVGIIEIVEGVPWVVHAVVDEPPGDPGSVKFEPLGDFFAPDRAIGAAIYRPKLPFQIRGKAAARMAMSYANRHLPFDSDFDLETPDKMYCTELVWRAYREAGIELAEGTFDKLSLPFAHDDYLLPSTLQASRFLEPLLILNPERK